MAKALLVQLKPEITEILSLNLPLYVGFETIIKETVEDAIQILKYFSDIDVIIAPAKTEHGNIALGLHNVLESENLDIPLLIFGRVESLKDQYAMITDKSDWRKAVSYCGEILGLLPDALSSLNGLGFAPVSLNSFFKLNRVNCDLYLKIPNSSKKEGFKFLKRIPAEEEIEQKMLYKWESHGIENLYIMQEDREKFGNHIAEYILNELNTDDISYSEKLRIQSDAYSFIQDEIEAFGISPKIIEVTSRTIDSMREVVQENSTLSKILGDLEKNKASYLYKHAILISFVANKILQKVEWGTEKQMRKMVFVAFFHDICLQHPEYCQIETETELKNAPLAPKDKQIIREHA